MFKDNLIEKISDVSSIGINSSRCLRMRFNKNQCSKCLECCNFDAIKITNNVDIKRIVCSECMYCVSVCPSGCFEIKTQDFITLIARLKKTVTSVSTPVIACKIRPDQKAHEKTSCFGFMSDEHILALTVFLHGQLQINLTECDDCRNGFIVDNFEKRINSVAKNTCLDVFEKIKLVKDKADLVFKDISYNRRGFFRALKNFAAVKTAELSENTPNDDSIYFYSNKNLPYRRELLNRTFPMLSESLKNHVLKNYYYGILINETCNDCYACVGMCPTGAIKLESERSEERLLFNSSLCSGCGLCASFCMLDSIALRQGYTGADPFEFGSTTKRGFSGIDNSPL